MANPAQTQIGNREVDDNVRRTPATADLAVCKPRPHLNSESPTFGSRVTRTAQPNSYGLQPRNPATVLVSTNGDGAAGPKSGGPNELVSEAAE
ncbi:hypothetical protein DL765_004912 [Monosporascus sp. GIB2]|nr:hypothetical protein DL765_004912 [Monosporascus sp. GIB2]